MNKKTEKKTNIIPKSELLTEDEQERIKKNDQFFSKMIDKFLEKAETPKKDANTEESKADPSQRK